MYVLLEGLDLAGKSTISRRLAEKWNNVETRRNSISKNNVMFEKTDEQRRMGRLDAETLGWMFYAALIIDLETFDPPLGNRIQDSTILLRSLAFHSAYQTPRLVSALESRLDDHPSFDLAFVFIADRETRLERLRIRRPDQLGNEDFLVEQDIDRFRAMEDALVKYATSHFNAEVMDSSGDIRNSDYVVDAVMERVRTAPKRGTSSLGQPL